MVTFNAAANQMKKKAMYRCQTSKGRLCIAAVGVFLVVSLCGCEEKVPKPEIPDRICPGQKSVSDLLELLGRRWANAGPFRANGQCLLKYYDAEGQLRPENFPVKLWVKPPDKICLYGDVGFDARGIVLGSNEQSFWLVTRPKEIRGYWWGRLDDKNGNPARRECFA